MLVVFCRRGRLSEFVGQCWVFAINNDDPRFRKWKAKDLRGRLSFVSYYRKRSCSSHDEKLCKMNMRMVNGRYVLRVAGYRRSLDVLLLHQVNNQSH